MTECADVTNRASVDFAGSIKALAVSGIDSITGLRKSRLIVLTSIQPMPPSPPKQPWIPLVAWLATLLFSLPAMALAQAVTEYDIPTKSSLPFSVTPGPDGALWFAEFEGNNIGRISTAGAITEFPVPPGEPYTLATGPDGALWFTEWGSGKIGRMTTAGTVTATYPTSTPGSNPYRITAGPEGTLWFTEFAANRLARITTTGLIIEYPTLTEDTKPTGIAPGPDGNLWIAEQAGESIARAPVCSLGFSASFAGTVLTMDFNLAIDTAATFNMILRNSSGPIGEPFSKALGPVSDVFTLQWDHVPDLGAVTVQSTLSAGPGQAICSEWTLVNTGQ